LTIATALGIRAPHSTTDRNDGPKGIAVPRLELAHLLELLGQEQACYTALLDLSRAQRRMLQENRLHRISELMREKQRVLDRLDLVERRLASAKNEWSAFRATLSDDDRQVLDLSLATAGEILGELISSEREAEGLLKTRRAA
jgi:hypothetical protein